MVNSVPSGKSTTSDSFTYTINDGRGGTDSATVTVTVASVPDGPVAQAFLTYGEGYHNFHHIFQADYRNGIRWWQWDPTKWMISLCSKLGRNVLVSAQLAERASAEQLELVGLHEVKGVAEPIEVFGLPS